jgi:hypothetical protein
MEWFYTGLAGINQAENSTGYRHIIIKPEVVGDITSVKAEYQSFYGTIRSAWKKENNTLFLEVEIPANTKATIYIPAAWQGVIIESGRQIQAKKATAGRQAGLRGIDTGSGIYKFEVKE